ncbi:TPA: hypothetical protein SMO99_002988 [Proteus mirabilis]|uniref:Uncharacterized protein n=1 Tax=Morganella morganii TaxID=582 RepID=A0AAI9HUC0_MORMO|nr:MULTISPECIES: hypothetical protein [Providencia]EJV1664306.1 hypothetical protein [Klebsiella pneumoniae]EKW7426743.1 hypothetical protein [Proteus mirabilis]EKW8762760.1 hypothetical protein [Morganella morganii]ELI9034649.1 hypothetical protein [Morganella morganii]ELR5252286.1 hypothetical protein [Providencia rettgeri]
MKAQAVRNRSFDAIKARAASVINAVIMHEATSAVLFALMVFGLVYCGVLFGVQPLK